MSKEGDLSYNGEIYQYSVALLQILDCVPIWMIIPEQCEVVQGLGSGWEAERHLRHSNFQRADEALRQTRLFSSNKPHSIFLVFGGNRPNLRPISGPSQSNKCAP